MLNVSLRPTPACLDESHYSSVIYSSVIFNEVKEIMIMRNLQYTLQPYHSWKWVFHSTPACSYGIDFLDIFIECCDWC